MRGWSQEMSFAFYPRESTLIGVDPRQRISFTTMNQDE